MAMSYRLPFTGETLNPGPFSMCTESEAKDRQLHGELSMFESTSDTCSLSPNLRVLDPRRVIQKYRRSAAGGGVVSSSRHRCKTKRVRSVAQLEVTVDYLLSCILSKQRSDESGMDRQKLVTVCDFVNDRIRAVQVDITQLLPLTTTNHSLQRIALLQAKLVRYNLLVQHLLSEASNYEYKFAAIALQTAFSTFFFTVDKLYPLHNDESYLLDEILSYTALLQLSSLLRSSSSSHASTRSSHNNSGEGYNALLTMSNPWGHHPIASTLYPKWITTLNIAAAADSGNYIRIMRLLVASPPPTTVTESIHRDTTDQLPNKLGLSIISKELQWHIMTRCCMAQSMPVLRIGLIRQYNKSFGKAEKVSGDDLARLLYLPSASSAIEFCASIGLPISEEKTHVIMKIAPISITDDDGCVIQRLTNPGRTEDEFVFGSFHHALWTNNDHLFAGKEKETQKALCKSTTAYGTDHSSSTQRRTTTTTKSLNGSGDCSSSLAARMSSLSIAAAENSRQQHHDKSQVPRFENMRKNGLSATTTLNEQRKSHDDPDNTNNDNFGISNDRWQKNTNDWENNSSRVDEDGILILPSVVLWDLIR